MIGNLTQGIRCTFYDGLDKYVLQNAPIGYDTLKLDIGRSKKTDGIMLDIIQDNEFVGLDAEYLKLKRETLGADGLIRYVFEVERFNNWEVFFDGFLELSSLKIDKTSVKIDYIDNDFDAVFTSNLKERFELDRLTDINDNPIDPLETVTYIHKSREIFLRSEFTNDDYNETDFVGDTTIVPSLVGEPLSDEDAGSVISFEGFVNDPIGGADVSVAHMFQLDASRDKLLKFDVNINFSVSAYELVQLNIYKYENGENLDYKETIQIGSNYTTDGADVIFEGEITIEVLEGESLMFGMFVDSGTYDVVSNGISFVQKEDSLFDPKDPNERKIDAVTVYQAFERLCKILSPKVQFKSDFIQENWNDVVLFSGETLRHVKYDGVKAPLVTLSFEELFDACFTLFGGIGYGIRKKGNVTILEIEKIDYFFDNEEGVFLGTLKDIEIQDNEDKIYSGVRLGFEKSGENEEVFGLQVGHTVNEFNVPVNTKENIYDATCKAIVSPEERELQFRKQASIKPDEDAKNDKDFFLVDAYRKVSVGNDAGTNTLVTYHSYEWQTHFESVDGLYSPNTADNYRFLPANCVIRHASNFKQEFTTPNYATKKLAFKNTKGNADISTTLIGGTLRPERLSIELSDLPQPLYGNKLIKGTGVSNYDVLKNIRAGRNKANYYRKFSYRNEQGILQYGFMSTIKADDDLKVELYNAI